MPEAVKKRLAVEGPWAMFALGRLGGAFSLVFDYQGSLPVSQTILLYSLARLYASSVCHIKNASQKGIMAKKTYGMNEGDSNEGKWKEH